MGSAYALCDPFTFEVRYVGITKGDPSLRLRQHTLHGSKRVRDWIDSVGTPQLVVLEHTDDLYAREREWIAKYDITTLLNVRSGESNDYAEIGRRGGLALKGKAKTAEHRANLSAAIAGVPRKPLSVETKAKISAARKGKPCNHKPGCACSFCADPGAGARARWAVN